MAIPVTSFTEEEVKNRTLPDCYIYISHLDGIAPQYWRLPQFGLEQVENLPEVFKRYFGDGDLYGIDCLRFDDGGVFDGN